MHVHIREIKFEVELPGGCSWGVVAILVHERQSELDDLQQVHITAQQLVLIVHRAAELPDGSDHHAGKFRVLKAQSTTGNTITRSHNKKHFTNVFNLNFHHQQRVDIN